MNYYDQHVHSSFSFDSQTELSDYLKHADGYRARGFGKFRQPFHG